MEVEGNLNVKNNIYSGGTNLLDIFITESTGSTVTIIESVYLPRQTYIEVYQPHPLVCKTTVNIVRQYHTPSPNIIKIPNQSLYVKCCGAWNPINSKYLTCMRTVDECYARVLSEQGFVTPGDIGRDKCGCKNTGWKNLSRF